MSAGRVLALAALAWLAAAPCARAQRSLHWEELSVRARLDADGLLHVEETQAIVFDGDWNGGERRFRLGVGQELQLEGVWRLDAATGARVELGGGTSSLVDHYDWHDARTLRWRSRDPGDPPFRNQEIVYVLRYRLSGILTAGLSDAYRLDHDFAFPDREGEIRRFALDLELDPAWSADDPSAARAVLLGLPPGRGHVVRLDLRHLGPGRPAGVDAVTGRVGLLTRAALVLLPLLALGHFFRSEARNGRFAALPVDEVDRSWLERHVLPQPPEVVGAAWDGSVGAPEVAAVLARMVGEGKLESRVLPASGAGKPELELTLRAEREALPEHERALAQKLFHSGNTTSTLKLREHYKRTGFDPAGLIRPHVEKAAQAYVAHEGEPKPSRLRGGGWLFLAGVGLVALGRPGEEHVPFLAPGGFALIFLAAVGLATANAWKSRMEWGRLHAAMFLAPAGLLLLAAAIILRFPEAAGRHALVHAGYAAVALSFFLGVLNAARSSHGPCATAFRKRLTAVRQWFRRELAKPVPALRDEWFPYLVAFGLERDADRWFGTFGSVGSSGGSFGHDHSSRSSSSGHSSTWTGGGGAFGGAGASATWGAAVAGLAAGVAAPSSGGSGGSGGGSSGSSGGGGGGGW